MPAGVARHRCASVFGKSAWATLSPLREMTAHGQASASLRAMPTGRQPSRMDESPGPAQRSGVKCQSSGIKSREVTSMGRLATKRPQRVGKPRKRAGGGKASGVQARTGDKRQRSRPSPGTGPTGTET